MTATVQEIPLTKLIPSAANVRKTDRNARIGELAASIKAHGLLQNLTVRKGTGENKGLYEVIAGGRRLAALKKLAKRKEIASASRIPCHVLDGESAEEISLAENVMQCPMHPADQYDAFAKLHNAQGLSAEDIGARFGVSAAVVRQRLKLGAVSPKLMKLYRDGELNLDQLTGYAVTDDHAAQERVWAEVGKFGNRAVVLRMLTAHQVPTDDRRFTYIGEEAYEQAGGTIIRDLFDREGGGFCADADLLNRLVREKLQRAATKVMAEGWKWVAVDPDFNFGLAGSMRRVYPALSAEDEAASNALEAERETLYQCDDMEEEELEAKAEALDRQLAAYAERAAYRAEDKAMAGAFVCLGHDGKPSIERGYVRAEDMKQGDAAEGKGEQAPAEAKPQLSDKLAAELTAYRTSALRNELAQNATVALVALTHALAAQAFYHDHDASCLRATVRSPALIVQAQDIGESVSEVAIRERHEVWERRMPREIDDLWAFIAGLDADERVALLAHCVSLGADAVQSKGAKPDALAHAGVLARALGLDMMRYWQPTAAAYFSRVSKDQIIEAVREADSNAAALRISDLKKQPMAEAAAKLLADKAWLPEALRTP